MAKQLKRWQGWLLFGGSMVVVFVLGLIVSSLLTPRASCGGSEHLQQPQASLLGLDRVTE